MEIKSILHKYEQQNIITVKSHKKLLKEKILNKEQNNILETIKTRQKETSTKQIKTPTKQLFQSKLKDKKVGFKKGYEKSDKYQRQMMMIL